MKALPPRNTSHASVNGARLYREELERIIGLFTQAGLTITISDDSFQFDSLDELRKHRGSEPRGFEIAGKREGDEITLTLNNRRWSVDRWGALEALAYDLVETLRRNQSLMARLPLYWTFLAGTVLMFLGALWSRQHLPSGIALMIIGAAAVAATFLIGTYTDMRPLVSLEYRHTGGFWRRNRDSIFLAVCSAVAGGVVTLVTAYLLGLLGVPEGPASTL